MNLQTRRNLLLVFATLGAGACSALTSGSPTVGNPGSGFGATQGGVQDIGLARELVANDRVPPPEAFIVEGMFSDHDLPLAGAPCDKLLCLCGAAGIAPTGDNTRAGWIQVGMSSTINPETYQRAPISIVLTVDVSGSMGWTHAGTGTNSAGLLARKLLHALADKLTENDRVAIVTYGSSVSTVLTPTSGANQVVIHAAIDALDTDGSTNMEAGLQRAYELARTFDPSMERRVMLFTDEQPNVGATQPTQFEAMVASAADDKIGTTIFGHGLGLGQKLFAAMAHLRGGNAFSVFKPENIDELIENDWPWMVSPIAYDLAVRLTPLAGATVTHSYGFPEGATQSDEVLLDVSTVFLSKKRGALLVELSSDPAALDVAAHGTLSYKTPSNDSIDEVLDVQHTAVLDAREQSFAQPSVGKTVALALLVTGMKAAAETYKTDYTAAVSKLTAVVERFSADAIALADPALDIEVTFASKLLDLMTHNAEQGDLYGR